MDQETQTLQGREIESVYTLNTQYANGKLELTDKEGNVYRIDVLEILKVLRDKSFKCERKRKYYHLTLLA